MTELQTSKNNLEKTLTDLINNMRKEIASFTGNSEYSYMLDKYVQTCRAQEKDYQKQIHELEHQMIKLNDELTTAFSELKKFEITLQRREEALKKEQERKEEIAVNDYVMMKYNYEKHN